MHYDSLESAEPFLEKLSDLEVGHHVEELTATSGTRKQVMRTHEKVGYFVVRCCGILSLPLRIESQSQCCSQISLEILGDFGRNSVN